MVNINYSIPVPSMETI